MYHLATFTTTDEQGKDVLLRCDLISRAHEHTNGAKIIFVDGGSLVVSATVSSIQTSINALWDEYITALGDPV